ncbi:hypothetical protein X943_002187 [Babesia divergens]|uniref:Uncharacterized protein n=1 Tax=Babesia divergens TaxID=32595 RepID=A0AAD9G7C4_BABDI|nr:hypothetical protein X943_002187 [Babesia divergens]
MTDTPAPKRRCTQSSRKKLLDCTREFCSKRLSEQTDQELNAYLQALGWTKTSSHRSRACRIDENLAVWVLNRVLTQLKKWMALQNGKNRHVNEDITQDVDPNSTPNEQETRRSITPFRHLEIKLVAYLLGNIHDINALYLHSHVLIKMATINNAWSEITLDMIEEDNFVNPCIHMVGSRDSECDIEQYRHAIMAIVGLLKAVYFQSPQNTNIPRAANRICMGINLNDLVTQIIDDVTTLAIWNQAFQNIKSIYRNKANTVNVANIVVYAAQHLGILVEILAGLLESNSNAKNAYNCLVHKLIDPLLFARAEIEDFRTHAKVVLMKNGTWYKDSSMEKMDDAIDAIGRTLLRAICFPLAPKFVPGIRDMLVSKEYEDLLDVEQLGNMDIENSAVTYNRKFFLRIVVILHQAQKERKALQKARGVSIILPELLNILLNELDAQKNNGRDTSYYGAMVLAVIIPLLQNLATEMKQNAESKPEVYIYSAALLDVVSVIYNVLNLANNKQIMVYSGERSEILAKMNEEAVSFVIKYLDEGYQYVGQKNKRKALMNEGDFEGHDNRLMIRKYYCETHQSTPITSIVHTIHTMWDVLLLLISLSLEYADTNIQRILQLLYQDSSTNDHEHYEVEAFNTLIKPKIATNSGKHYKRCEEFAATLVSMYSHANDMATLVDHIGKFIEGMKRVKQRAAFLTHIPAIQAFHNSSRESSSSQIPIVIRHFTTWLKNTRTKEFIQYPLISYLSGIEVTSTVVGKVVSAFENLLPAVRLKQTPEGVLMALYSIISIRKINAWLSIDGSHIIWSTHMQNIYEYVSDLTKIVGDDCSPQIWNALFWFAYHLSLIARDNPYLYGHMNDGVEMILKKIKYVMQAKTNDREFIKTATTLLTSNANVFRDVEVYSSLISIATTALINFEMDEGLMENIRSAVGVLAQNGKLFAEVFNIKLLTEILKTMQQEQTTTKMKSDALYIVKLVLQMSTDLYRQSDIAQLFDQLVKAASQMAKYANLEDVLILEMINEILALVLFVLRREEQLETHTCSISIVKDFLTAAATTANVEIENNMQVDLPNSLRSALDDIKGAIKFIPGQGGKRTLAAMQQVAELYKFIVAKCKSQKFMDLIQWEGTIDHHKDTIKNLMVIIAPTLVGREEGAVLLRVVESAKHSETSSFTRNLADAVVLGKVIKMMQEDDKAQERTPCAYVQASKPVTKVIGLLMKVLKSYNKKHTEYMLYLSSLLYVITADLQADDVVVVFKYIVKMNAYTPRMMDMEPYILENLCDSELELLGRIMEISPGRYIKTYAVSALFSIACAQQVICSKRRGVLGNRGTQLEVFKVLCGIQVERTAHVVRTFFLKAKSKNTWKAFTEQVVSLYHKAENLEAPYEWLARAAALEVLMLVMDRQHLKTLSNIKGEPKRKVLDDVDTIIRLHSRHISQVAKQREHHGGPETMHWVVMNYLINTAISIKMFISTRFQVNKYLKMVHYAFAEQLLDLARLGIDFMQPGTPYAKNDILYSQIAANVYMGLYSCIRTVEGLSNSQIAKLARPWMKRIHVVVYIVTQFVGLIASQDADMFAYVARWMNIVSDAQLRDATRWYIPHMLTAIIKQWHRVHKEIATFKGEKSEILRSNKILRNCITESISSCDNTSLQTLFLLLSPKMRLFMKENTDVFNRN